MNIKIISGGQTGADRAALDFALEHGLECGGWCPKGRKSEDKGIPSHYPLVETATANYLERTELNVRDSDGTAIFTTMPSISTGGTWRTIVFAKAQSKPYVILHDFNVGNATKKLRAFIQKNNIRVLNVAGARASKEPKVAQFVYLTLTEIFRASI